MVNYDSHWYGCSERAAETTVPLPVVVAAAVVVAVENFLH